MQAIEGPAWTPLFRTTIVPREHVDRLMQYFSRKDKRLLWDSVVPTMEELQEMAESGIQFFESVQIKGDVLYIPSQSWYQVGHLFLFFEENAPYVFTDYSTSSRCKNGHMAYIHARFYFKIFGHGTVFISSVCHIERAPICIEHDPAFVTPLSLKFAKYCINTCKHFPEL